MSRSVWIVLETYDTGAGPRAESVYGIYANERDAMAVIARCASVLIHHAREEWPEDTDRVLQAYGRLHCWFGRSVRFHMALGATCTVLGYKAVEEPVVEALCSCGHDANDTVPGRDEGYVACAGCGMQ